MSPEDSRACDEALAEVMAMYSGHTMTVFEASTWAAIIDGTTVDAFRRFLQRHVLTAKFAPRPSDAASALGLGGADAEQAYALLERDIRKFGPYRQPEISDPVLVSAIQQLGGWAAVNEQLPDIRESFATKAFRDRFDAAYRLAGVEVCIQGKAPQPLLSLSLSKDSAALLGVESSPRFGLIPRG